MFSFQLTELLRRVAGSRFDVGSSVANHYREAGIWFDGKYICACERNEMPREDVEVQDPVRPYRMYLWRGWKAVLHRLTIGDQAVRHIPRRVRARLLEFAEREGWRCFLTPEERASVAMP